MTYAQSIEFLYGLRLFGLKLGLENTRRLAALTGNPQERLQFIHIAGTNGKGSVAAMLESIYRTAGLRVGLYTSPHLVSFRERIQVNRQLISEADVVRLVDCLREVSGTAFIANPQSAIRNLSGRSFAKTDPQSHDACPTFFELVTVMALQYFAEQNCDLVIWETGLGGRLDATNIVTPLVSVITNIEHDHQRWLGHDLKSIAFEKAGIIKPGIPTITATSEPEALAVIQETALAQSSTLTLVTPAHTQHPPLDTLALPLHGWHQRLNAAIALATVQTLRSELNVSDSALREGLRKVSWPGRLQLVERGSPSVESLRNVSQTSPKPRGATPVTAPHDAGSDSPQRILLDGAHNASGATALRGVLEEEFADAHPVLILGILKDKDWDLMCEILAPLASRILCVPVKSERATEPAQLAEACRRTNPGCEVTECDSMTQAMEHAATERFIVIAGSLYLVGEAMELLHLETSLVQDEKVLNEWSGAESQNPKSEVRKPKSGRVI